MGVPVNKFENLKLQKGQRRRARGLVRAKVANRTKTPTRILRTTTTLNRTRTSKPVSPNRKVSNRARKAKKRATISQLSQKVGAKMTQVRQVGAKELDQRKIALKVRIQMMRRQSLLNRTKIPTRILRTTSTLNRTRM